MRNLILKFWYVACVIFCLYSLNTLVEERYEVAILASDPNKTDPLVTLACKEISKLKINKNEIRLEELRDELIKQINNINWQRYPSIFSDVKERVLNRLKTGQYVIFKGLLCVSFNKTSERFAIRNILYPPVFFAFKRSTLDFAQMAISTSSFDQLSVQMKGPPYSNCSESNGKFGCLNECFRKKFRLAHYFYWGNETGTIHLSQSTNRTIEENEKFCFEKCWKENCEMVQFVPIPSYYNPRTTRLEAKPKLSELEFWIQFIGLVCSFANISLNQFASMTIKFASSKVRRRRVRIGLLCLKWAILFLSMTYCGYLYTNMVLKHQAEERNPTRKEITRNLIKQNVIRLAICLDINEYIFSEEHLSYNGFSLNYLKKTMLEIEKTTDGALDDHLESIHVNYQGRLFRVNYILEPKVLFRYIHGGFMFRCFILVISPDYQLMPSNPKLTIKFRKDIFSNPFLYLLTEDENLNENTFRFPSMSAFMKRIVRRLESSGRCGSYRKEYVNCTSRRHCVEWCINREAFKKFEKIVFGKAVVDKDQFTHKEWNRAYPMEIPYNDKKNQSIYLNFYSQCFEKFQDHQPCVEVTFNETVEIVQKDPKTKKIDLCLDIELSIEEFTWFNLLLNIMSTHTTFFSVTVLGLLKVLYSFIKPKLRNEKIAQFLIYLLCSVGFTWHTYRILDLTINEELTYNPNYEIANRVRMPMVVFCLPVYKQLIDRNHQLTGNYLEKLTSYMTAENVFESIFHLDKSNQWIPFNLSLVERFFFMHLKCFNITIDREYDRRQLHFSTNQVLKVNFHTWFSEIFFMTKINDSAFSNVLDLVYHRDDLYSAEQSELTVRYEDRLRFIKRFLSASYEDDSGDLDRQLPELNGSDFSFRTLKVPVEEDNFDFELQDDLFEQFFTQIKKATSNPRDNLEYQQTFVFNQLKRFYFKDSYSDSHFTFRLSLIKKTIYAKNEANLILGLLNVLFWFDVGILDLYPIFIYFYDYLLIWLPICILYYLLNQITRFVLFSHRWLKKFERPLYIRLNARRLRVPRTRRFMFV